MSGLQGSGKTTFSGKLANLLKSKRNKKPLLVACDVYRPAAIEQLKVVGEQIQVPVYAEPENKDVVAIAQHAIQEAKAKGNDVVIVDTAGRLAVDEEMMNEIASLKESLHPSETLFVVDAMTGQDAVNTAKEFNDRLDFDGVILTKLDGDTRGGAALSIRTIVTKPIKFVGTGEKMEALDVFHPNRMADRILGMGDMLTLIEQAEAVMDEEKALEAASRLGSGELTLEDFLDQMLMIRRMGPLGNILKMLPGGKQMSEMADMVDEKHLDRIQAIIRGMTPEERINPKILNASRRKRIANGSGVTVTDVNQLVERFFEAKKMMGAMAGQMGMGGMGKRSATKKKPKGRKGKNGKRKGGGRRGPSQPRMPMGGFPGMGGGMPGMPGGGMPDMAELQKLQQQMGGKLPKGMENIDFSQLGIEQDKKK